MAAGSFGSSQFSRPPTPFGIAGPNKIGAVGPVGPPFSQSVTVVAGITNGATVTLSPAVGQDVILPMPGAGGTVTINVGTVAARQRVLLDIINGATLATVVFQAGSTIAPGFIAGSTLPLASYTGRSVNTTDNLTFIAPGTVAGNTNLLRLEGLNVGFPA